MRRWLRRRGCRRESWMRIRHRRMRRRRRLGNRFPYRTINKDIGLGHLKVAATGSCVSREFGCTRAQPGMAVPQEEEGGVKPELHEDYAGTIAEDYCAGGDCFEEACGAIDIVGTGFGKREGCYGAGEQGRPGKG